MKILLKVFASFFVLVLTVALVAPHILGREFFEAWPFIGVELLMLQAGKHYIWDGGGRG